ncbi:hypothetical protein HKX48_008399 [Thoreauomyces humboldtii]|nr:hypothetical protein HKX48_008399 [Thoreauomyces humboldtii]
MSSNIIGSHPSQETFGEKVHPSRDVVVSPASENASKTLGEHPEETSGIGKIKAVARVWGPTSMICFYIGVAMICYTYSLDGVTTYLYQAYATSSFSEHSDLGAIVTAQAIVLAVSKPVAAKISDVFGRAEAFTVAIVLYVFGYILLAACKIFETYAAGAIIYYIGYASVQILIQILIADVTNLRWRGLISSLTAMPFFINFAIGSNIAAKVIEKSTWHWGYGMFCIILPVGAGPIIATLFWAQNRARKLGVTATNYGTEKSDTALAVLDSRPFLSRMKGHLIDLDLVGLILFSVGFALVLLPITLVNGVHLTWNSGKVIAMLVLGVLILIGFVVYEALAAPKPLFPLRFFRNRTIMACALIPFFDFVSFYIQYTFQYSFIYVTHTPEWSVVNQGYFAYTQTLALTFFAVLAGGIQYSTRRSKWLLVTGLVIRLVGVGAMIHTKGVHGSTAGLVLTQIVQGAGGGIAACATQTLAQASVPHQDVSAVTALVLLFAEIGNAVGSSVATGIWKNEMPGQLHDQLGGYLNDTSIDQIFGSIGVAASFPRDSPVYDGIITAYGNTMRTLLIVATCIAVVPILLSFLVQDVHLTDDQNAVEKEDVGGERLGNGTHGSKDSLGDAEERRTMDEKF